jgi:hypothetical protein
MGSVNIASGQSAGLNTTASALYRAGRDDGLLDLCSVKPHGWTNNESAFMGQTYHLPLLIEPRQNNFARPSELIICRLWGLMKHTALKVAVSARAPPSDSLENESIVFIDESRVVCLLSPKLGEVLASPDNRAQECWCEVRRGSCACACVCVCVCVRACVCVCARARVRARSAWEMNYGDSHEKTAVLCYMGAAATCHPNTVESWCVVSTPLRQRLIGEVSSQ